DQAHIGRGIVRENLLVAMLAIEEHDGLPLVALKTAIDALGLLGYLLHQIAVTLDMGAARRTDLHKRKLPLVRRILLQEPFNGAEPLRDSFGVVHAIDPHAQKRGAHTQLREKADALYMRQLQARCWSIRRIGSDADRECTHPGLMAGTRHGEMLPLNAAFQRPVDSVQKIVAMRLNVEADQVRAQQAVQQLASPGTNSEGFRIWPRDMPEDGHSGIGANLLDEPRQQREMIVLHQHHRVFFLLDLLQYGLREFPVDGLIMFPIFNPESRAGMGNVA